MTSMRETATLRSLERAHQGRGRILAQIGQICIALAFVVSMLGVHSALARAEVPGTTSYVLDIDHHDDDHSGTVLPMAQAAHLAGHLTCVVDPAVLVVATIDATRAQHPIPAIFLPCSTTLAAPTEPPRA
jgi:hypothetical protein